MVKSNVHLRLVAVSVAVALTGALIILVTLNSERRSREARTRLSQVDSESFGMAEHFKDQLREVNDKMRRYASYQMDRMDRLRPSKAVSTAPDDVTRAEILHAYGEALGADVEVAASGSGYRVSMRFESLDAALDLARRLRMRVAA